MSRRRAFVVLSEPLSRVNAAKFRAAGFDARGAVYHSVVHRRWPLLQAGDYMVAELADGSVFAAVYTANDGPVWTPLAEGSA